MQNLKILEKNRKNLHDFSFDDEFVNTPPKV